MATYNSYAELQAAIARWLNRDDDPDILNRAAEFIGLAESAIRRNQEWFTQIYSLENGGLPLSVTAQPMELPVYVKELKSLWAASNQWNHTITVLPISAWRDLAASNADAEGIPTKAVLVPQMDKWMKNDGTRQGPKLYLWPKPAISDPLNYFSVDFQYVRDVLPLSDDTTTNGLFLRHPDLYLYGALVESAPFYEHDERLQMWQARYDRAVSEINIERERAEFGTSAKRVRLPRSF